jgi:hypothetical protein
MVNRITTEIRKTELVVKHPKPFKYTTRVSNGTVTTVQSHVYLSSPVKMFEFIGVTLTYRRLINS